MSDTAFLNPAPLLWDFQGETCALTPCDLGCELLFQAEHEAWAVNRLEATRAKIGREAYERRAARLEEMVAANRFAFGSPLSLQWLSSRAGLVEYVRLLAAKGGKFVPASQALAEYAASKPVEWDALADKLLRRDFPNLTAPDGSSGAGGNPAPSTSASTSSSPAGTGGASPETKSTP